MAVTAFGLTGGVAAAGAVAAVAGLFAYGALRAPAPPDPALETAAAPPVPVAAPEPDGEPAPDGARRGAARGAPTFDLVRVAPDGSAVVAGRAAPGAKLTIFADAGAVAEAEADAAGEFVAVFKATPGAAPQALTLEAEDAAGGRTASPDVVMLLPAAPDAAPGVDAEAAPSAPAEVAAEAPAAEQDVAAGARARASVAAVAATPAPEVAATAVLRGDAVEATPAAPGAGLTLASISYGETGLVTLAGLGPAGGRLRAYVDDRFAREGAVDATGRWALELDDVAAGVYRLRIDALGADGAVESRIETPFQRDFPAAAAGGGRPAAITVQPGNNLWTLARIHYGAGVLYTQIHTANRDLIRDPELIYPGQILVLPEDAPAD